jgi:hypothetical protein
MWGLDYYLTPLSLRPDHAQDALFRPTGLIGNRLGIVGTVLIAFGVVMYSTRKRWQRAHGLGKLRHWLSFHIWLCTLGPFLILLHTSFKVGGIVSIAFWSMVVVVASGVLGRYVYVHIPKTLNGQFLRMQDIEAEHREARSDLLRVGVPENVVASLSLPKPDKRLGLGQSLALAMQANRAGRGALRHLRSSASEVSPDVLQRSLEVARQYRTLALGRVLLDPFGRLFRYWHAVHLPLAILMSVILLVHIAVAVLFGYGWTSAAPALP